jgi:hypothetical protein
MFAHRGDGFVRTNSFFWLRAEDMPPGRRPDDAEGLIGCSEGMLSEDGRLATVSDFIVRWDGRLGNLSPSNEYGRFGGETRGDFQGLGIPELEGYLEPGSFWDLAAARWRCPYYDDVGWRWR